MAPADVIEENVAGIHSPTTELMFSQCNSVKYVTQTCFGQSQGRHTISMSEK